MKHIESIFIGTLNDSSSSSDENDEKEVYNAEDTAVVHSEKSTREYALEKKMEITMKEEEFYATELTLVVFLRAAVDKFGIT